MMRKRWFVLWLVVWAASIGLVAGCGGGHAKGHRASDHRASTTTPLVVTAGQQSAGGSAHPPGWGLPPKGSALRPKVTRPGAVATAEMFDTITLATVPHGAPYLAGYTSGFWPTYFQLVRLPWSPHVVSIAVTAGRHAQCLDIEPGDAAPSQAAVWFWSVKHDPGMQGSLIDGKPCEYSSFWEFVNQVIPVLRANGISRSMVWEWDANYTLRQHLDQGFDCTQFTDRARGLNLDESECTLAFLGFHPTPPPPPPPHYPYPVKLMTSSEDAVLKHYYNHHCAGAKSSPCAEDRYRAHYLSHNIWAAKAKDHRPWGFRNRGIRFHVLTIIEKR